MNKKHEKKTRIKNMNKFLSLFLLQFLILFLFLLELNDSQAQSIEKKSIESWTSLPEGLHESIDIAFESPTKKSTLTLRKFKVKEKKLQKNQVNTWIKDYNSYGFSITTQKPLKLNTGAKGFFIKAFHKNFEKNFLQFISIKDGHMSTLTCKSSNASELEKCKEAMMTFTWKKIL